MLVDVARGARVERLGVVVADLSRLDFFRDVYGRSPGGGDVVHDVLRDSGTRRIARVSDDDNIVER